MNRHFDGCMITYGITYGLMFVGITDGLMFVGITHGLLLPTSSYFIGKLSTPTLHINFFRGKSVGNADLPTNFCSYIRILSVGKSFFFSVHN